MRGAGTEERAAPCTALHAVWMGRVPYADGIATMQDVQARRIAGEVPDQLLFVEHDPVYTRGRATPEEDLLEGAAGTPVVEVPRGGLATWHGPGQLVVYPVLDLRQRTAGPDLAAYLRALEGGIIAFLASAFGITGWTSAGQTGVWVGRLREARKIASIGVSARRWVTAHGAAINVRNDLEPFRRIRPCGFDGAVMTSAAEVLAQEARVLPVEPIERLVPLAAREFAECFRQAGFTKP